MVSQLGFMLSLLSKCLVTMYMLTVLFFIVYILVLSNGCYSSKMQVIEHTITNGNYERKPKTLRYKLNSMHIVDTKFKAIDRITVFMAFLMEQNYLFQ